MRASEWLAARRDGEADIAVLGAPIGRASISPSRAWTTPPAFREALHRFSTYDGDHDVELETLRIRDLGDVAGDEHDPDTTAAHARIEAAVAAACDVAPTVVVIGGDNSATRPVLRGLAARSGGLASWGLLTLDAHHDVREAVDGPRNGTPVRDLIGDGLGGERVAQVGLHGFANAREHVRWARSHGVRTWRAAAVRQRGAAAVVREALRGLSERGAAQVHADVDMDVLDRAFAPACPASMPGGLCPAELQEAAFTLGADARVRALDLVEVDASADAALLTVRALASVFLAFCAGVAWRLQG